MMGPMTGREPGANATKPRTVELFPINCLARKPWLLAALLVLLTFTAYKPAWRAGFIWDDDDHLTTNAVLAVPYGLSLVWTSITYSRYYPLTLTTFWCERQLWGLNPLPYHLVNIALHAINGLLVFLLLRRLRVPAAWLAAAVWVLHPVNVESVAWITELKNTQSGFFFFGALLCFLQFETKEQWRWYGLALLCGACALLSKASTVVLPLALLLCVWWERGYWRRHDFLRMMPFFVMAGLTSLLAIVEQRGNIVRQGAAEWSIGMGQRLLIAGKAIGFYFGKIIWPVNLTFVYPRWELAANSPASYLPIAGVVAVGTILWTWRRQSWARAAIFGLGFFVVALLPVLGFFDVFYFRYSFVADHFQYLASLGVIACITSGMVHVLKANRLSPAIYTALLVTLSVMTWRQSQVYQDSETLWGDTVAKNPNGWMPQYNFAETLWQAGRHEEAVPHFERALQLNSRYTDPWYHPEFSLTQLGRLAEAIGQSTQKFRIKTNYAEAHNQLGLALLQTGRPSDAIPEFQEALRLQPDYPDAQRNLKIAFGRLHP